MSAGVGSAVCIRAKNDNSIYDIDIAAEELAGFVFGKPAGIGRVQQATMRATGRSAASAVHLADCAKQRQMRQIDSGWCVDLVPLIARLVDGAHHQFEAHVLLNAKGSQFVDEFVDLRQVPILVFGYLVCLADHPSVVGGEEITHVRADSAPVFLEAFFAFQPGLGVLAEADGGGGFERRVGVIAADSGPEGDLTGEGEGTGNGQNGHRFFFSRQAGDMFPTTAAFRKT